MLDKTIISKSSLQSTIGFITIVGEIVQAYVASMHVVMCFKGIKSSTLNGNIFIIVFTVS